MPLLAPGKATGENFKIITRRWHSTFLPPPKCHETEGTCFKHIFKRKREPTSLFLSKTRVGGGFAARSLRALSLSPSPLFWGLIWARVTPTNTLRREETAAWAEISPQVASSAAAAAALENLLISVRHSSHMASLSISDRRLINSSFKGVNLACSLSRRISQQRAVRAFFILSSACAYETKPTEALYLSLVNLIRPGARKKITQLMMMDEAAREPEFSFPTPVGGALLEGGPGAALMCSAAAARNSTHSIG